MKPISIPLCVALLGLALTGCVKSGPDYTPVGDGLKAIGISLVVCAVVAALADLIRAGEKPSDETTQSKRRKPRNANPTDRR